MAVFLTPTPDVAATLLLLLLLARPGSIDWNREKFVLVERFFPAAAAAGLLTGEKRWQSSARSSTLPALARAVTSKLGLASSIAVL